MRGASVQRKARYKTAKKYSLDEAASPRDRGSGLGELCELGGVGYRKILV